MKKTILTTTLVSLILPLYYQYKHKKTTPKSGLSESLSGHALRHIQDLLYPQHLKACKIII
ncbi:hypothetical protein BUZ06_07505 [Staphylococcus gallinarum]|nr:hypothetical protein BUZ06_07505 [Staphylococcus gallinarum]